MPKDIASHDGPRTATDIIIEYKRDGKVYIPLIERKNPPFGLAIPGGFQEKGETTAASARREAKEETNLDVVIDHPEEPFLVLSEPTRDPRGHVNAIVYIAKGYGELKAGDDAVNVHLHTPQDIKNMRFQGRFAFDHEETLTKYLYRRGYLP